MFSTQQTSTPSSIKNLDYHTIKREISQNGGHKYLSYIDKLLQKNPEDWNAWILQGIALRSCGNTNEAIESINKSLLLNPTSAEALYQLASIMQSAGHHDYAISLLESAIRHEPTHWQTLESLREHYTATNQANQLVSTVITMIMVDPTHQLSWIWLRKIIEKIGSIRFPLEFTSLVQEQIKELNRTDAHKANVAGYIYLSETPSYQQWGTIFGHTANQTFVYSAEAALTALQSSFSRPLFSRGLVSLPDFENFVRNLRYSLLKAWHDKTLPASFALDLFSLLATYLFRIEYVPLVTEEETQWLQTLDQALQPNTTEDKITELLLYACYASLSNLTPIKHWYEHCGSHPALQNIMKLTYEDFVTEKEIRATIPRLVDISDTTSNAVREQYEESPYPRWTYLPPARAMRVMECIKEHLFMETKVPLKLKDDPNILIAGCGTGIQTLLVASRFPRAKILSIDLSSASIAYAMRKAKELKLDKNLEFMQADILDLDKLNRQFDIVESIGVLHHMQDPMAGWRILTKMVKSGGAMRIGLYSKIARKDIIAAREEIAERGLQDTIENIRQFRNECLLSQKYNFIRNSDFYTTSNVRDLLFHRSEQQFTIPQLQSCLKELGLQFMGFQYNGANHIHFNRIYPNDRDYSDLAKWEKVEESAPSLFMSMYQFWCYKPR